MNDLLNPKTKPMIFDPKSRYVVGVDGTDGYACIVRGRLGAESEICRMIYGELNVHPSFSEEWSAIRASFQNSENWTMDVNSVPYHWAHDTGEGTIHVWIVTEAFCNA